MMEKLKSRKLIATVLMAVLVLVNDKLGLGISQEAILTVVGVIAAYVVGQGVADAGAQGKKPAIVVAEGSSEGPNWEDTSEPDAEDMEEEK